MTLTELRTLSALAAHGSLAATSEALHLSPAAVHKHLKQLEAELGVRLYERIGRGVRLSAAAAILVPFADSALAQVEAGRQAIEEWRGVRRGIVRLGSGPTLSNHWVPGFLQKFRHRYPSILVTVETGNSIELLDHARRGDIDLALLVSMMAAEEKGFEVLARWTSRLAVVTGDRALATCRRLEQLRPAPFISFRKGSRLSALTDQFFQNYRHEPNVVMRFDNADAVRAVLRTGFGYALLPEWTLEADLAAEQLFTLSLREPRPTMNVEMVRHTATPLSPAARAFVRIAKGGHIS